MKEYQRNKNNPYKLPHNVYMQVLYAVRDYDRLRDVYQNNLYNSSSAPDGTPHSTGPGDPTQNRALRMYSVGRQIESVEQALVIVPNEYRRGIIDNIKYRCGYPVDVPAHPVTWSRWRSKFLWQVAKNMGLI